MLCTAPLQAGDKMAGDSIGEYITLKDRRIPLPARGILEPARVCLPCSYESYDL